MRCLTCFLNIQYIKRRVADQFPEHNLCPFRDMIPYVISSQTARKYCTDSQLFKIPEQVDGSSVKPCPRDNFISALADSQQGGRDR